MGRAAKSSSGKRAHSPEVNDSIDKHPRVEEEEADGSDTEWTIVKEGAKSTGTSSEGKEQDEIVQVPAAALEAPKPSDEAKSTDKPAAADSASAGAPAAVDAAVDGAVGEAPAAVNATATKGPATTDQATTEKLATTVGGITGAMTDHAKDAPKPLEKTQADLQAFGVVKVSAEADAAPEDKILYKGHYPSNAPKRFNRLVTYVAEDEGVFAIRREPFNLEWSTQSIKGSRLLVSGQVTPAQIWVLGEMTWNGLLPVGNAYPARAKVGVAPLRQGDLVHARQIIKRYSKSKKDVDVNNLMSISAHTDMSTRTRGAAEAEAKPFHKIYDGRQIFMPDKEQMNVLSPKDLMRGDVVLLEVSVGRYWDDNVDGRIKDWSSTRAFFHLESITLIVNGADADESSSGSVTKPKKALVGF